MRWFWSIAWILLASRSAAAQYYVDSDDNEWHDGSLELSGGAETRSVEAGAARLSGPSLAAAIGLRQDRTTLEVAYAFGLLRDGDGKVFTHDLALRYRRALLIVGGDTGSTRRGAGWLELGFGGEAIEHRGQGTRLRPLGALGVGVDFDVGKFVDDEERAHRYLGGRVAARLLVGRAPDDKSIHDAIDLGILVSAEVVFGRSL